jgi:hypothetical protein
LLEIAGGAQSGLSAIRSHTITGETLAADIPGNPAATRRAALAISKLA